MTYDVFTYNGEREILNLHLNILDKYVDKFVIVESKTTFSGNDKPLYFSLHEKYFEKFWPKIDYFIINEEYSHEEIKLAEESPNTIGARHWKNEFLQKESIKKALVHLKDTDRVYIGDVDEIWQPYHLSELAKLKLKVYSYYLNNRSDEEFWGTLTGQWKDIKNETLNHLRSNTRLRTEDYYGWHFTSMGGVKEVRRKLNDSYTSESYNTYDVQAQLPTRISQRSDFLGRPFTYTIEDSEWPLYLKKNRRRFNHLCVPSTSN